MSTSQPDHRPSDERLTVLRDCWACGTGMDFDQKPPKCLACGAENPCGDGPMTTSDKEQPSSKLVVDQTDIDIALEQAQVLQGDGQRTAADCIRACANAARAWIALRPPAETCAVEPGGVPTSPALWNAVSHLLSHWDEHRKCFDACHSVIGELKEAFAASAAPGQPEHKS